MTEPWVPANRVERRLAWALTTGDLGRYFRVLASAELFQAWGRPGGDGPDGRELVTVEVDGSTALPVFTSYEAMAGAVSAAAEAAALTSYPRLREAWPDPGWLLAVDPGLPIEAYLRLDVVERGRRGEVGPDDPDLVIGRLGSGDWRPWPEGPHEALLEAVALGDAAEYLDALLDSMVTMATTRPAAGPEDYLGPEFPWRPVGPAGSPVVEVFTDPDACAAAYPGVPSLTIRFLVLVLDWPPGHGLAVNPGGPAGLELPAPHVPLLREWVRADAPVPLPLLHGLRWTR